MEKFFKYNAFDYPNSKYRKNRDRVLGNRIKFYNAPEPSTVVWEKLATVMSLRKKIFIYTVIVLFTVFVIMVEITLLQI